MATTIDYFINPPPSTRCLEICFSDMKCNMNCEYCYGDHKTREFHNSLLLNKEVLREEFKKINEPLYTAHLWGGELLFNKEPFKEVVSLIKESFPNIEIHVMTNGLLLPNWLDFILENQIHIGISHDGPGQKYRGYDFLESSKHNDAIKTLYDAGLFRKFKSVLHNKNYSIENIINYFSEYSNKIERKVGSDQLLITPNTNSNSFIFKTKEDISNLCRSVEWSTINILKHLDDPKYLDRFYQSVDVYHVIAFLKKAFNIPFTPHIAVCAGSNSIAFTATGKHIPCHCFSEKSFIENDIKLDFTYVFKKCKNCPVNYVCGGGCSAQTKKELDLYCVYAYHYYSTMLKTIESLKKEINIDNLLGVL